MSCTIEPAIDGVKVTIAPPQNRKSLQITGAFSAFFGLMLVLIVLDGLRDPPVSGAIVFAALLFAIGALGLLWQVGGRQVIAVDAEWLRLRWSFLGVGCSRRYGIASVSRLRPVISDNFALACDAAGKTVMFGQGLDQFAARRIVALIGTHHPLILEDSTA